MLVGVVDIGSNTIKMMVGESNTDGTVDKIYEKTLPVRLGAGTFETGLIPKEGIQAGVKAVSDLLAEAKRNGAERTAVFATSAVRNAANAGEFISSVKSATGADVVVLNGQEEAEMIFRGVCTDKELRSRRLWVADVGGGSVEFILGANGIIEKKISLELGSVRIMSMFCPQLPANAETPVKMRSYLNEKFGEALTGWETAHALAVATGGSALCIARWEGKEDNCTLTLRLLNSVIEEVWQMDLETLNSDHRIPKGRGEVLLAGAVTYASALECVKKNEFTVSKRNLRYGLVDAVSKGCFSA